MVIFIYCRTKVTLFSFFIIHFCGIVVDTSTILCMNEYASSVFRGATKNIDQWGTGRCGFNTENAIFEKFSPEVLNFAKKKGFS